MQTVFKRVATVIAISSLLLSFQSAHADVIKIITPIDVVRLCQHTVQKQSEESCRTAYKDDPCVVIVNSDLLGEAILRQQIVDTLIKSGFTCVRPEKTASK